MARKKAINTVWIGDTHCETARNPNGQKVGEMDIIPKEGSDTVD